MVKSILRGVWLFLILWVVSVHGAPGVLADTGLEAEAEFSRSVQIRQILASRVEQILALKRQSVILHQDHLGSVSVSTDFSGQVTGTKSYNAFGGVRGETGYLDTRGFSGQEVDESTGLIHYKFRDLDPRSGRWVSPDPLYSMVAGEKITKLGESTTAYAYASNQAINQYDPTGLNKAAAGKVSQKKLSRFGRMKRGLKKAWRHAKRNKLKTLGKVIGLAGAITAIAATGGIAGAVGAGAWAIGAGMETVASGRQHFKKARGEGKSVAQSMKSAVFNKDVGLNVLGAVAGGLSFGASSVATSSASVATSLALASGSVYMGQAGVSTGFAVQSVRNNEGGAMFGLGVAVLNCAAAATGLGMIGVSAAASMASNASWAGAAAVDLRSSHL